MLNVNIVIREPFHLYESRFVFAIINYLCLITRTEYNQRECHTWKPIPLHAYSHTRTHTYYTMHTHTRLYSRNFGTYYAIKYVHVNLYTNREWSTHEKWHHRSLIGSHAIGAHMLKMFIQITEIRIYTFSYVQLSYSLRAEFLIVDLIESRISA